MYVLVLKKGMLNQYSLLPSMEQFRAKNEEDVLVEDSFLPYLTRSANIARGYMEAI